MQIDVLAKLLPSGGFENIVTVMDVFFSFLLAYPTSNQDAKTMAKGKINIMIKQAY